MTRFAGIPGTILGMTSRGHPLKCSRGHSCVGGLAGCPEIFGNSFFRTFFGKGPDFENTQESATLQKVSYFEYITFRKALVCLMGLQTRSLCSNWRVVSEKRPEVGACPGGTLVGVYIFGWYIYMNIWHLVAGCHDFCEAGKSVRVPTHAGVVRTVRQPRVEHGRWVQFQTYTLHL